MTESGIIIETDRLGLRLPCLSDALDIQRYAGAWEVAQTTSEIPHPYQDGMAESFIQSVLEAANPRDHTFVIVRKSDAALVGMCAMRRNMTHFSADIGYWIGVPYWGNGYATEAARALIDWGFEQHGLNRIWATYITINPASRRVMEKAGMTFEGIQRQAIIREIPARNYREIHDLGMCAILRQDWEIP